MSQNNPVAPQTGASSQRSLSQLIANLGPQSKLVDQSTVDPRALSAGIKPSFASVSFKGKTWGIRYRGITQQLLARGTQGEILGAIPTIDVVIVKSATAISKTFYIDKFKDGSFAPPDCWSTNGQVPDIAAAKKQSETCRGCRWDKFGSRTMDDGRAGKACADSKRIAIVPATDLKNEAYGGPMLLKLPPSAFNALGELETQLHLQGYVYFAVVMRLSFDHEQAFPKIVFTPVRVLSDAEIKEVLALQELDVVDRILSEELTAVSGDPGQPTTEEVVTPVVTPAPTSASAPAPAPTPAPPIAAYAPPVQAFQPVAPAPVATLSPEQQRIRDLEAALAAAKAGTPAVQVEIKPPRKTRARTAPVTPAETLAGTANAGGQSVDQTSNGSAGNGEDTGGDTPVDLDSRIDKLLNPDA